MRQVLVNLVGNAVKFTERGEVEVRVETDPEARGASRVDIDTDTDTEVAVVRFSVRDTGIGISEERLESVFEAFAQADRSISREYGGTGLGLAICRRLVGAMGGTMSVDSDPGAGSTFRFTIPLPVIRDRGPTSTELGGRRVLVVDDHAAARRVMRRTLEAAGCRVRGVEDARSALQILREAAAIEPFELAVLDLRLPDVDGLTLAEWIEGDSSLAGLPLILVTAGGEAVETGRLDRLHFHRRIRKPFKPSVLIGAAARALEGSTPSTVSTLARSSTPSTPSTGSTRSAAQETPTAPERREGSGPAERVERSADVPSHAAEPGDRVDRRSGGSGTVLVADDSRTMRLALEEVLHGLGFETECVEGGEEAVEAFRFGSYELVLLDCQMPGFDGFRASSAIRRLERSTGSRVPIVGLVSAADPAPSTRSRCAVAGMDDCIGKPIEPDALEALARRLVSGPGEERGPSSADPHGAP